MNNQTIAKKSKPISDSECCEASPACTRQRKRRRNSTSCIENSESPELKSKKIKMSEHEKIGAMVIKQMKEELASSEERMMTNFTKAMNDAFSERIEKVESKMDSIVEVANEDREHMSELEGRIKAVENKVQRSVSAGLEFSLLHQVNETEKNIIVIGLKAENLKDGLKELSKIMQIPEEKFAEIQINQAFRLGKPTKEGEVKPICYKLGNASQKFLFFEYSRNLPKGIRIDIDSPLAYRTGHRIMKDTAKHLRNFEGLKTMIKFNNHVLTLRVRNTKDEKWAIYEEFVPSADTARNVTMKNAAMEGGKNVYIPNGPKREKTLRTLRIGNIEEKDLSEVHSVLSEIIKSPLKKKLGTVSYKNGAVHLIVADRESLIEVHKKCTSQEINLDGKKLYFDYFQDKNNR